MISRFAEWRQVLQQVLHVPNSRISNAEKSPAIVLPTRCVEVWQVLPDEQECETIWSIGTSKSMQRRWQAATSSHTRLLVKS